MTEDDVLSTTSVEQEGEHGPEPRASWSTTTCCCMASLLPLRLLASHHSRHLETPALAAEPEFAVLATRKIIDFTEAQKQAGGDSGIRCPAAAGLSRQ